MDIVGTVRQKLIYLHTHWARWYEFAAPEGPNGKWAATARFGNHDELAARIRYGSPGALALSSASRRSGARAASTSMASPRYRYAVAWEIPKPRPSRATSARSRNHARAKMACRQRLRARVPCRRSGGGSGTDAAARLGEPATAARRCCRAGPIRRLEFSLRVRRLAVGILEVGLAAFVEGADALDSIGMDGRAPVRLHHDRDGLLDRLALAHPDRLLDGLYRGR